MLENFKEIVLNPQTIWNAASLVFFGFGLFSSLRYLIGHSARRESAEKVVDCEACRALNLCMCVFVSVGISTAILALWFLVLETIWILGGNHISVGWFEKYWTELEIFAGFTLWMVGSGIRVAEISLVQYFTKHHASQ